MKYYAVALVYIQNGIVIP